MRVVVVVCVLLSLGVGVGVAAAGVPSPRDTAGNGSEILGVVPTVAIAHSQAGKGGGGGGDLVYHGGPVLLTNKTVAIYWGPGALAPGSGSASFPDAGYQTVVNRYFSDVAAASGTTSNVYAVERQYYNSGGGHIQYASSAGTALVDDSPYPASGCSDTVAATTVCLSDSQIQAEVARVVPNPDPQTVYFVFTGKGAGSCYSGSSCAFSSYCAYHSSFTANRNSYLYANQPYADTVPTACDAGSGYHPNGAESTDADATINVASHEHRESINDPFGNAWYDRRGYEGSDKCAWNFGSTSSGYNQTIHGSHYALQQEWSNAISGCALGA
jgi:hypothetical protein